MNLLVASDLHKLACSFRFSILFQEPPRFCIRMMRFSAKCGVGKSEGTCRKKSVLSRNTSQATCCGCKSESP